MYSLVPDPDTLLSLFKCQCIVLLGFTVLSLIINR